MVISWLRWTYPNQEVWIVPSYSHAFGKNSSPFSDRVEWCKVLRDFIDPVWVTVCEVEKDIPKPSYTIDTLRELRRTYCDNTFKLVVGSDVMGEVDRWKDWDIIEEEFSPIVVGRTGYPHPRVGNNPTFPNVSSTDIRQRLAMGKSIKGLVPQAVIDVLPVNRRIWAK